MTSSSLVEMTTKGRCRSSEFPKSSRFGKAMSSLICGILHCVKNQRVGGTHEIRRCGSCKHTFNALTGTPLAGLRHKEVWLEYAEQMAQGQSVRRSANACGVHRNTAFRWRHRFLSLPKEQQPTQLEGIVEADETFFLEAFKGQKRVLSRASASAVARPKTGIVR